MTRINTNVEALRGLRNLQKTQSLQQTTLARLSTGLQINSGKDNPAGLIASERLRLQTTTIEQSIKNSNRANNVIGTADSALGEISGLLNQVRGLVQEGLNVGALSSDETQANQSQIDAALSAINRISANTSFAGSKLIDGSKAFSFSTTAADTPKLADVKINEAIFGGNSTIGVNAKINTAAEKAQLNYVDGALTSATTLDVKGNKGSQTLFLGASSTLVNVRDAINNVTDATGVAASIKSGLTKTQAAVANTVTTAIAGNNNDLVFTDARRTTGLGSNSSLGGAINVVYAVAGNSTPLSIAVSSATNGDKTITVNLATNANGAATTTAAELTTAIGQNADASALVTVANAAGNDGTGTLAAVASTALTGGTDAGKLAFTDKRTTGAAGAVNIVFANGGNSQALSVGVTRSGNDSTVTVNLATDASGGVTSTLASIKTALEANTSANGLVALNLSGDTTALATTLSSTALSEATGTLELKSSSFGSDQFIELNVLSGSFGTVTNTGATGVRDNGADVQATINGQAAQGSGLNATIRTSQLDATLSFGEVANVAGSSATVTITGGGSLFQIGQEASAAGQIGVGIEGVTTARLGGVAGKLYQLGTGGGKSLIDIRNGLLGVGSSVSQSGVVDIIDQALNRVSTLRGRLGAIQKNVIDTNVSTLGVALENISDARSQIVDTDFASETAQLQKTQTLSQAGISVLSIANQNPQQVLSLLRG